MAAVDSLLRIAVERGAEGLVIASGAIPELRRGDDVRQLSMPRLDASLVDMFVGEVVGDARGELDDKGSVAVSYRVGVAGEFAVTAKRHGDGYRLEFMTVGPPPPIDPPPRPASHADNVVALPVRTASSSSASVASRASIAPAASVPITNRIVGQPAGGAVSEPANAVSEPANAVTSEPASGVIGATDALPVAIAHALAMAEVAGASDVFVSVGQGAHVRNAADGLLRALDRCDVTDDDVRSLVRTAGGARAVAELEATGSADFALDMRAHCGARYRVNAFRQHRGLAIALRPIRTRAPTFAELGLPDTLGRLAEYPSGLVLIGGAAGSGKSTTAAALVEHVNRTRAAHIVTLEDPIELELLPRRSLVHQREIGAQVASFDAGLRAAVRESPDVILLGEMRDRATIAAALTAAETGHLVISTIHARNAAWAVQRIVDVFPAHAHKALLSQLAGSLRAVVTQVLVPAVRGGRVPAYEILVVTHAVAQKLREGSCHHIGSLIETGKAHGMITLERVLDELVARGTIRQADADRLR